MPKSKYLFAKLIKCENCGNNYRGVRGRTKNRYICNGYSMKKPDGCKERYGVDENDLIQIIQTFCNRNGIEYEGTNDFMKSVIATVTSDGEDDKIRILYRNGEEAVYSNNQINI